MWLLHCNSSQCLFIRNQIRQYSKFSVSFNESKLKNLTEELNNETLNNCKIVFNKMYWEIFRTICDSN